MEGSFWRLESRSVYAMVSAAHLEAARPYLSFTCLGPLFRQNRLLPCWMLLWEGDLPSLGSDFYQPKLLGAVECSTSSDPTLRCREWLGHLPIFIMEGEKKDF